MEENLKEAGRFIQVADRHLEDQDGGILSNDCLFAALEKLNMERTGGTRGAALEEITQLVQLAKNRGCDFRARHDFLYAALQKITDLEREVTIHAVGL